jgi:hypothetical protein
MRGRTGANKRSGRVSPGRSGPNGEGADAGTQSRRRLTVRAASDNGRSTPVTGPIPGRPGGFGLGPRRWKSFGVSLYSCEFHWRPLVRHICANTAPDC